MAEPGAGRGAPTSGFQPARDRIDPRSAIRIVLGLLALFIAILAALAILNAFFIEPQAGPPTPQDPAPEEPGQETGGGGGGDQVTCGDVTRVLMWVSFSFAAASLVLLAVGIVRRGGTGRPILGSVWGILAMIGLFLTLITVGAWQLVDLLCTAESCQDLINGFYAGFLVLLGLTVGSVTFGIGFAHLRRVHYFRTGVGIVGVVLFLPAWLAGLLWYFLRVICNEFLSCATRDEFLDTLTRIFWICLVAALLSVGIGVYVLKRHRIGLFASGWPVFAIMLVLLAASSGGAYLFVKQIYIPFCDPPPEEEQPDEPPECQELLDQIATVFWWCVAGVVLLTAVGLVVHRKDLSKFFSSIFAIFGYILLGITLLVGLAYLMLASICEGDEGDVGQGEGEQPGGGGEEPGPGGEPGGGGQEPGGGGGGTGPGGGGGGEGIGTPRLVDFNPLPLTWVFVIVAAIAAVAILLLLLRRRKRLGLGGPTGPPPEGEVALSEQAKLLKILDKRSLASAEAIIAAYRIFLAWSAGQGLSKEPHETPLEHATKVLAKFDVSRPAMEEFIGAYEVARLSGRQPTPEERRLAVRFSREILGKEGSPEETEP